MYFDFLCIKEANNLFRNVEPAVKKETQFIALVILICSAVMQAVYLVIGQWNYRVLLGNLLGAALATGNFFLMGLAIQKALGKSQEDAAQQMKLSQRLRLLLLGVVVVIGAVLPCFDLIPILLPLLFPRIGVNIRGIMLKKQNDEATLNNTAGKDRINHE